MHIFLALDNAFSPLVLTEQQIVNDEECVEEKYAMITREKYD
jgi:hypothetical protein